MQGMFVGDDETPGVPPARYLQTHMKTRVAILNPGVMGYSPEQYYYSLIAFADRFRPQFVIVSVFVNDVNNKIEEVASRGVGDWEAGKYWLEKIGRVLPGTPVALPDRAWLLMSGVCSESGIPVTTPASSRIPWKSRACCIWTRWRISNRRTPEAAERGASGRAGDRRAASCSTTTSVTHTSRRPARRCGPPPWAAGSSGSWRMEISTIGPPTPSAKLQAIRKGEKPRGDTGTWLLMREDGIVWAMRSLANHLILGPGISL